MAMVVPPSVSAMILSPMFVLCSRITQVIKDLGT
jgi:hypothetical protein